MDTRKDTEGDFFYATLEGGGLVMEPHCACGNFLEEEYFCEKCNRQCVCTEIRCRNAATLEHVNGLLKHNEKFKHFNAVLAERTGERIE